MTSGFHQHGPTVARNIESIVRLEEEDERQLSSLHKVSHRVGWFVGTIHFVVLQVVLIAIWVVWNSFAAHRFDPYPFPLLSAVLALEAVLLTSFVLIRQNAMDLRSERRNHLDLQINLLAEREATSILKALAEIAQKFDIDLSKDAEHSELSKNTPIESIVRGLRSKNEQSSVDAAREDRRAD